ncbi:MAG: hypothetical protein E6X17_14510 [Sporomusaceae bacterium]|nr:hypothetical protein [Sporomusaceae bacterium]
MTKIAKKIVAYTMLGMLQIGFGATAAEAASLHSNNRPASLQRQDKDHHEQEQRREKERREQEQRREKERREQERRERVRQENERHEREMKRRPHESERDWRHRQKAEKERHDNSLREIAALVIGFAIGSASN